MLVLTNKYALKDTINELKSMGYSWICGNISPNEIIKSLPKNTIHICIDCFNRDGRKVMQYQTEKFYKTEGLV